MKNQLQLFLKSFIVMLTIVVFHSCEKDNRINNNQNTSFDSDSLLPDSFTYLNFSYHTPVGYISPMHTAEGDSGGTYELFFPTNAVFFEKIKRTNSFGTFWDSYPKGIGNAVKLRFTSKNTKILPSGEFSYSFGSFTPEVFNFISIYTGYDFTSKKGTISRPTQSSPGNGKVIIRRFGATTTIIYDFTLSTGKNLKGSFHGILNTNWYSTFNNNW